MDWYEVTGELHSRTLTHDCDLLTLPTHWQRELAAAWRLEADVNNGGYLQFLCNWGPVTSVYAAGCLRKIGALRMSGIVEECQTIIDDHWLGRPLEYNSMIAEIPSDTLNRIESLSDEFMSYPENVAELGIRYYASLVQQPSEE